MQTFQNVNNQKTITKLIALSVVVLFSGISKVQLLQLLDSKTNVDWV